MLCVSVTLRNKFLGYQGVDGHYDVLWVEVRIRVRLKTTRTDFICHFMSISKSNLSNPDPNPNPNSNPNH